MVSVLTSDTMRYGYASTIQGVEEAARAAGRVAAITVVGSSSAQELRQAVDLALSQPVAGVIILEFDESGALAIQQIPRSVPLAVVSPAPHVDVPHVLFDDRSGGAEATRYLLGLGHRTVHHVSAPSTGHTSGRLLGWQDALREAGVVAPEVVPADWSPASGYEAGLRLAGQDGVTAVFCGNDEIAFGVIRALQASGLRVPEDISVVGFDDHPLAPLWTPSLTTISQDFVQLGRAAVRLLLDTQEPAEDAGPLAGEGPVPHLVVRESSAPPSR
nr:substrate-binding domain-containing protein [Kineosporia mesophila]